MSKHKHQHHHYLNKIGISSKETCVFNTHEKDSKRGKSFKKERKKHSFDSRETLSLDYTLLTWLYEHILVYLDIADQITDLDYHKIKVDIITGWDEKQNPIQEETELTERQACWLICEYIKKFFKDEDNIFKTVEYEKAALHILAEVAPCLWW